MGALVLTAPLGELLLKHGQLAGPTLTYRLDQTDLGRTASATAQMTDSLVVITPSRHIRHQFHDEQAPGSEHALDRQQRASKVLVTQ